MLKAYLNAWFRILGMKRRGQTILYVDGFAGPGFPAATGHQAKESGDVREPLRQVLHGRLSTIRRLQ